ncbi:MAG: T9SS type A sorting domain-containing protein [candidate division Zixibacteria bacterium]|nr:T9SS type A sorting domain-containing protein [Candidatus Tariuqbacter arcticus]
MRCIKSSGLLFLLFAFGISSFVEGRTFNKARNPNQLDTANPYITNRTHRAGNEWLTVHNFGYIGNDGAIDPETGTWAPQCEFPGGSDVQYLFSGSLWIGALMEEEGYEFPRVSTGNEGWFNQNELFPGEGEENGIIERSCIPGAVNYLGQPIYSPDAVAAQEFIAVYTDTLTDPVWVGNDPIDGPHRPLDVKVTQKSMVWDAFGFDDFTIFEYNVENIGTDTLKNLYLGLYVDADVGWIGEQPNWHQDDITGFLTEYGGETWNLPYTADNDGRPYSVSSGSDFYSPGVAGSYVLLSPGNIVYQSHNWWISNWNPDLDFGPSWIDDGSGGWTITYGTPVGDERKYFLLGNNELDYDQVCIADSTYIQNNPQQFTDPFTGAIETHYWKIPDAPNAQDIANGYDTRYLIAWGPLGENVAPPGQIPETYLYPGDSLKLTLSYVCGDSFHDVNNPQPTNTTIDPSLFVYDDLVYNVGKAQFLYDNNFEILPPYTPQNFKVTSAPDSAIWLEWDEYTYMPGTMADIYRSLESGQYGETPINPAPITGTAYADTDIILGTCYYYQAQGIKYDSLKSYFCEEISFLAGAPLTPTGLEAISSLNEVVELSWEANTEPDLNHYIVYRQDSAGVFQPLGTTIENSFSDVTVTNGVEYIYAVSAVDDDGFESNLSDTAGAIPMGFYQELLVVLKHHLNSPFIEWENDSLDAYYQALFADIGEIPDFIFHQGFSDFPSLEELSPYKVIWIIDDNHNSQAAGPTYRDQRDQVLTTYLSLGGNLVYSGRCVFFGSFGQSQGLHYNYDSLLRDYFQTDEVFATRWPSMIPQIGDFIRAESVIPEYPSLDLDSAKFEMLSFLFADTLLEIDGMIPTEVGETIYTYQSTLPDSSPLQGMATGVRYNNWTVMLTFPLYVMEPYDSVLTLAESVLEYVRLPQAGVEDRFADRIIPDAFSLRQNYPNPFNARTTIEFEVPHRSIISIRVYNVLGRQVAELADETFDPGVHRVSFDGAELSSGIYFVNMTNEYFKATIKVLLIK